MVLADKLAQEVDAYLVFHSQYMHHTHIPDLEKLEIESNYGYENNPGVSKTFLENAIIKQGHELVLDTAHFYLGDHTTSEMKQFLEQNIDQISLIHLCDSSDIKDGLGFGEGIMDMKAVCKVIDNSDFDGIVVLEVMPDYQKDAFQKWKNYIS
jgi:sugar phosphate isomerase/epimerase